MSEAAILPDATWVPQVSSASTLVVLPTYNERENLEGAVRAVREVGYDVLVVDDSSPDGTADLAVRMAESDPGVHLMVRPGKLGLGSAYVEGFRCGLEQGYSFQIEMVYRCVKLGFPVREVPIRFEDRVAGTLLERSMGLGKKGRGAGDE